jgi:hypothetical protein
MTLRKLPKLKGDIDNYLLAVKVPGLKSPQFRYFCLHINCICLWQIFNMRDICGDLHKLGFIFYKLLYSKYNRKHVYKSDAVKRDFGQSLPSFHLNNIVSDEEKPKSNCLFKTFLIFGHFCFFIPHCI